MTHRIERGPGWSMHLGRWQDALAHVTECDALITDPPYSERTHTAYREMAEVGRAAIGYASFDGDAVRELVGHWSPRARGWLAVMCDHGLAPEYEAAAEDAGRYAFAHLACVEIGSRVRLSGDGPCQWSVWLMVSRPRTREAQKWGALPGAYVVQPGDGWRGGVSSGARSGVTGGKPLWLMRAIIRDYTRPGDLVVDPCAGGGTTLLAAVMEGRRAIGAEMDPATFGKAVARLRKGYTAPLFSDAPARMEQTGLSFPVEPEPAYEPIDREPERPGYTDDELCAIEMVSRMEARA